MQLNRPPCHRNDTASYFTLTVNGFDLTPLRISPMWKGFVGAEQLITLIRAGQTPDRGEAQYPCFTFRNHPAGEDASMLSFLGLAMLPSAYDPD